MEAARKCCGISDREYVTIPQVLRWSCKSFCCLLAEEWMVETEHTALIIGNLGWCAKQSEFMLLHTVSMTMLRK